MQESGESRSLGFPGPGVTVSCGTPELNAGNSGPLGEQQLLTAEPSLQSL